MNKILKSIAKWSSLSLAIITTGFIVYQSAIDGEQSAKWETMMANFFTNLFNNGFNMKEEVVITPPESIDVSLSNYSLNHISGYQDNELPIGCTKQLFASVLPEKTSNKNVQYEAYPSNMVNLVQSGNYVYVEGLSQGEVTIKGISNADNSLVDSYTFNVVSLSAPYEFSIDEQTIEIKNGESYLLDIHVINDKLNNDPLLTCRYYDNKKLIYTFDNNEHASADENGYIKALSVGDSLLTISNGNGYHKEVPIHVIENDKELVEPTSMSITGNDYCYIGDMDYDRSEKGLHNTPLSIDWGEKIPSDQNVIWESDNPLVATVDNKGVVRGFRNTSNEDVPFVITATSVMNPNIKARFHMTSNQVLPTGMKITTSKTVNENDAYCVYKGESLSFSISFSPSNVTKKNYSITSDNDTIHPVISGNSFTLYGQEVGNANIVVTCLDNKSLQEEMKTEVSEKPFVNEENAQSFSTFVRKILGGHATLFLLDSIFLTFYIFVSHYRLRNQNKYLVPLALFSTNVVGFIFAGISEWIQYYIPGRSCLWSDVCIDMYGWLIGFVISLLIIGIILLIRYLMNHHQNKKKISPVQG